MKNNIIKTVALAVVIIVMGACGDNAWDDLPSPISKFVEQYFPMGEIQSYTVNSTGSVVKIKHGATIGFDNNYAWVSVDGNGLTLPQEFLYDCLPEELYDYILSAQTVNEVYSVEREHRIVTVSMLDNRITYDEITGTITVGA